MSDVTTCARRQARLDLAALLGGHRAILHRDGISWTCQRCPEWRSEGAGWNAHEEIRGHQMDIIIAAGWRPPDPERATDPERPSTATLAGRNDGSDLVAPVGYAVVVELRDDGGRIVQASAVLPKSVAVARAESYRTEFGMQTSVVELREVTP